MRPEKLENKLVGSQFRHITGITLDIYALGSRDHEAMLISNDTTFVKKHKQVFIGQNIISRARETEKRSFGFGTWHFWSFGSSFIIAS